MGSGLWSSTLACLLAAALGSTSAADIALSTLFPTPRHSRIVFVINDVLKGFHYRGLNLSDELSTATMKLYFQELDPERLYFLARDVDRFMGDAGNLHDDLSRGRIDTAFDIFRVYRVRIDARIAYAVSLLTNTFNFDLPETYLVARDRAAWAKIEAELDEAWRKRVKNDYLLLKLGNQGDEKIRTQLRKRYEGMARRIRQLNADDVLEIFVNAYTRAVEPHTGYLSPRAAEDFDITMRLSVEGIGAVLAAESEYTVIQRTIPGGPARRSGRLSPGDRVVGVAQGPEGEMEDVVGWRLQDVVDKIRGPQGTVVRLRILPKDPSTDARALEVALVRSEVSLGEMAADAFVISALTVPPPLRIGVVEVPTFYHDFLAESEGKREFRSTTRDVRRLVDSLTAKGIDGLIIDLRGNGGGSLSEATSLTGLFVDQGPVAQLRDASGKIELEVNSVPNVIYNGPLAVLVDRDSASASEIFAAAIQDYSRGIVVGEQTFGKGTVQTLVNLDQYAVGNAKNLGRLRLTTAALFRLSGESTQLRGVEPDIHFHLGPNGHKHGERSYPNPLPWGRVEPVTYSRYHRFELDALRKHSLGRTAGDLGFQLMVTEAQASKEIEEEKEVSLRESERRVACERRELALEEAKTRYLRSRGMEPVNEGAYPVDEEAVERQQRLIDRIQTEEAARILADIILTAR